MFTEFGIPHTLKSDNGSPFQSDDFAKFANYLGFKHRRITPYWPRANAECERSMKTFGKCMKAATAKGRSYKQNLHAFLLNYRATPHPTTGISPATALFGRAIRTRLPELSVTVPDESTLLYIAAQSSTYQRVNDNREKRRSVIDTQCFALQTHS